MFSVGVPEVIPFLLKYGLQFQGQHFFKNIESLCYGKQNWVYSGETALRPLISVYRLQEFAMSC